MRRVCLLIAAAAAFALLGCGDEGASPDAGPVPDEDSFCARSAANQCAALLVPCCGADPVTCPEDAKQVCLDRLAGVVSGGFTFEPEFVEACLAASPGDRSECQDLDTDSPAYRHADALCRRIWVPPSGKTNLQVGDLCDEDLVFECMADLYCDGATGMCTPMLSVGSTCADSGECTSQFCDRGICIRTPIADECRAYLPPLGMP